MLDDQSGLVVEWLCSSTPGRVPVKLGHFLGELIIVNENVAASQQTAYISKLSGEQLVESIVLALCGAGQFLDQSPNSCIDMSSAQSSTALVTHAQ